MAVAPQQPTSPLKNRVWGFEQSAPGRPVNFEDAASESATGYDESAHKSASGRADFLTRDPAGIELMMGEDHWILDGQEVSHQEYAQSFYVEIPNPLPHETAKDTKAKKDDEVAMGQNDRHKPGSISHYHGVDPSQPNIYTYVNDNPWSKFDPLGLWQITISGGLDIAGSVTVGNNGGTGLFNGNWNVGASVGVGAGLKVKVDSNNKDPNAPPSPRGSGTVVGSNGASFSIGVTGEVGGGGGKVASASGSYFAGAKMSEQKLDIGGNVKGNANLNVPGNSKAGVLGSKVGVSATGAAGDSLSGTAPNMTSTPYLKGSVNTPAANYGGSAIPFSVQLGITFPK